MLKLWRGLITKASTEHRQTNYQITERTAHAIVRRLVSKEDMARHPQPHINVNINMQQAWHMPSSLPLHNFKEPKLRVKTQSSGIRLRTRP